MLTYPEYVIDDNRFEILVIKINSSTNFLPINPQTVYCESSRVFKHQVNPAIEGMQTHKTEMRIPQYTCNIRPCGDSMSLEFFTIRSNLIF